MTEKESRPGENTEATNQNTEPHHKTGSPNSNGSSGQNVTSSPGCGEALVVARGLIDAGIPVFVARPATDGAGNWDPHGGHNGCGYWLPSGWQNTQPDPRVLDHYQDGDALALVCGFKVDGIDADPRNGGDESRAALERDGVMPCVYGEAATPSGGTHELVASMGVRSRDKVRPGLDVKAGAADGTGRGCLFIAPTRRASKVDGSIGQYRWTAPPNVAALAREGPDDRSGERLAGVIEEGRRSPSGGAKSSSTSGSTGARLSAEEAEEIVGKAMTQGEISQRVQRRLNKALTNCCGADRHPHIRDDTMALLRLGQQGESGVDKALRVLLNAFVSAVREDRPGREAEAQTEFVRFVCSKRAAELLSEPDTHGVADQEGQHEQRSSLYTDIGALLDGTLPEPPTPELLTRADGTSVFYKGEINVVFGDPEHGKTWVALCACAQELLGGGRVVYVDLDNNGAQALVSRLLQLRVPQEVLADPGRFRHCQPDNGAEIDRVVKDCQDWQADAVVIDSIGKLLPRYGASSDSGDDFARVHDRVLLPLARTGGAVLAVDHLAKGRESRGYGPGGTMAKRRDVGGASIRVVRKQVFTRDEGGEAVLWVNKDRHGGVRRHCPPPPRGKDEQLAGTFILDPPDGDGASGWRVIPESLQGADVPQKEFRPTHLMERVSIEVENNPGQLTKTQAAKSAHAKNEYALKAVTILEREEYLTPNSDHYPKYTSAKPYRERDDPLSDRYVQPDGDHFAGLKERLLDEHAARNVQEVGRS